MAYTLYAPQNITARTEDIEDIEMLLTLPKLARFVPAAVLSNPDVIANRSDTTQADSPTFIMLHLEFDATQVSDVDELESNVTTWAQRCRIGGVRGQRLAVVSEPEENGDTIFFTVLIGTVVFYNERRATVGVSITDDELRQDLSNLSAFVPVEPSVKRAGKYDSVVQILPAPTPFAAFSIDPAQSLPVVSLEQVVLSLIRLGTEAAPMLVSNAEFSKDELKDRIDNLQLELAAVRANLN